MGTRPIITLLTDAVQRGVLREDTGSWEVPEGLDGLMTGVPTSLQQMIDQHIDQLTLDEQKLLEAASVVGKDFNVAAVAAQLEQPTEMIEGQYAALMRRQQVVQENGVSEWPDGTVATRYTFLHDLYHEMLYARVPAGQRVQWHRRIGLRLEQAYGNVTQKYAGELAMHFLRGHDGQRAASYLYAAGEQARLRHAYHEALSHFSKGIEVLNDLPETCQRLQDELQFQISLGAALIVTKGYADPDAEHAYTQAQKLCRQLDLESTPQHIHVLSRLSGIYDNQGHLRRARELGEQCLSLAQCQQDSTHLRQAHQALGRTLLRCGELTAARFHLEQARRFYDPQDDHKLVSSTPRPHLAVPRLTNHYTLGLLLQLQGYPDQAQHWMDQALLQVRALSHPYSQVAVLLWATRLAYHRREVRLVREYAEASIALATENAFTYWLARGRSYHGWALVIEGETDTGLAQICQSLEELQATGITHIGPADLGLLAEAYERTGQIQEGLCVIAKALERANEMGEQFYKAELYRLKGELLLKQSATEVSEARACFYQALDIAGCQEAKSLELRSAMSLCQLEQNQGNRDQAYKLLSEIYHWFTEGFDTVELQEAHALLEADRTD